MKNRRFNRLWAVKNAVFFTALGAMALTGAALPLRPRVSELEKRELAAFPELTWRGVLDGSFAAGIDRWYSDTYPMRDALIYGDHLMEELWGDRSEQVILSGQDTPDVPEAAPPAAEDVPETAPNTTETTDAGGQVPSDGGEDGVPATAQGEVLGSLYVSGGSAYSLYYFSAGGADMYAGVLDRVRETLDEDVEIWSMPVPLSSGVVLDRALAEGVGASDQREAIEYINSRLGEGIHGLNIFDALAAHRGEYIYFRTDHHWTALGAYYAYAELCREMGIGAHGLDTFEKRSYEGFLGTFYSKTLSKAMKNDPDRVDAYVPAGTNSMTYVDSKGRETAWYIVKDVDGYNSGGKYYCFAGSDQPYAFAHNPEIGDGSACLVVKDSFGNAFVPFLVDHYEYVYWIDFRYYGGTIGELAEEKGVEDVIFCLNVYNTTSGNAVKLLERLVTER